MQALTVPNATPWKRMHIVFKLLLPLLTLFLNSWVPTAMHLKYSCVKNLLKELQEPLGKLYTILPICSIVERLERDKDRTKDISLFKSTEVLS